MTLKPFYSRLLFDVWIDFKLYRHSDGISLFRRVIVFSCSRWSSSDCSARKLFGLNISILDQLLYYTKYILNDLQYWCKKARMSGHKYEEKTILSMFSHWNSAPLDTNPMNFSANSVQASIHIIRYKDCNSFILAGECDFATTQRYKQNKYTLICQSKLWRSFFSSLPWSERVHFAMCIENDKSSERKERLRELNRIEARMIKD